MCRENPHLLKMGKTYRKLYANTHVRFTVSGDMKPPKERSLQVQRFQAVRIPEEV